MSVPTVGRQGLDDQIDELSVACVEVPAHHSDPTFEIIDLPLGLEHEFDRIQVFVWPNPVGKEFERLSSNPCEDVDDIGDCFRVAVLDDEVLIEEPKRLLRRSP